MDLEHGFGVPVDIETAWAAFQDISSIAECFPGATVTSVEGDTFTGTVKVKLGPIALTYNGSGSFTEQDEANHRFVVDAKGKDKRGNGTAGATVTVSMEGDEDATDVQVHTDLAITGKPAQFGRGVIQDVSDKLLGQFVACLEQRLSQDAAAPEAAIDTPATVAPTAEDVLGDPSADPGLDSSSPAGTASSPAPPAASPGTSTPVATPRQASPPPTPSGSGDALDLGRTVLPVLVRGYWKQALAVLVVAIVLVWLIAR
jgi:carbon monoxide dehydrogenase subunit G